MFYKIFSKCFTGARAFSSFWKLRAHIELFLQGHGLVIIKSSYDLFQCSVTCGGGNMTRSLMCKRRNSEGNMILIHHLICANIPRPATVKPCNQNICPSKKTVNHLISPPPPPPPSPPYLFWYSTYFLFWSAPLSPRSICSDTIPCTI